MQELHGYTSPDCRSSSETDQTECEHERLISSRGGEDHDESIEDGQGNQEQSGIP